MNLPAKTRLRDKKSFRSPPEVKFFGHRDKVTEMAKL
jgi:hypothetical protein